MSSLASHTTRAPGTILTASIYNEDHLVHITNAQTLDTDKVEQEGNAVLVSLEVVDDLNDTHETFFTNTNTGADADVDVIWTSGTNAEFHIFASHADGMTHIEAFDGGIALDTADADVTLSAGGFLGLTIDKDDGVVTFPKQSLFTLGLLSSGGSLGYGAGAGGAVTQGTSKTTAVTLDKPSGQITTHNESMLTNTTRIFTVNCNKCGLGDVVVVNHVSGGTVGNYTIRAQSVAAGTFNIFLWNNTAGTLSDAVVINYSVIKGSTT